MKKVLVVYYSQSGQLRRIAERFMRGFEDTSIAVDWYEIKPVEDFPFPWTDAAFFWAFPESYLQVPQALQPIPESIAEKDYDLIVLAYQVWYLSSSIPITSFLKSEAGKRLIAGKPVITLSGTRNMWVQAQKKVKALLSGVGAELVGNIALTDRHANHISVITIVQWMFSGNPQPKQRWLPKAGVSEDDIEGAAAYGELASYYTLQGDYAPLQRELVARGAVHLKPFLLSAEKKGNRLFGIWARLIYGSPRREFLLKCFRAYLYVAIWVLMPIVALLYWLTYPLAYKKIRREMQEARGV